MLQWTLLLIGIIVIVAIYAYTRYQSKDSKTTDAAATMQRAEPKDVALGLPEATEIIKPSVDKTVEASEGAGATSADATGMADEQAAASRSEILIINVCAHNNTEWSGEKVMKSALSAGLECGDNQVFEYRVEQGTEQVTIFYVANFINPGTFDFSNMADAKVRGLSLCTRLPVACSACEALDMILNCAGQLADKLDGDICNHERKPLSKQEVKDMKTACKAYDAQV